MVVVLPDDHLPFPNTEESLFSTKTNLHPFGFQQQQHRGASSKDSSSFVYPHSFHLEQQNDRPNLWKSATNRINQPHGVEDPSLVQQQHQQRQRLLGGSQDNNAYQSIFVDAEGNAYEPYSLAWRYLGLYIDCDIDETIDDEEANSKDNKNRQRHLNSKDNGDDCSRKLLWAAYVDPGYRGGAIGEYQFLDRETETWNTTTCHTKRCARMDCHDPHSQFKLLGVYKESDGFDDWAEQLFKHHAYCQWDSDTYETMDSYRQKLPADCNELYYPDSEGNDLWSGLRPLPDGNITVETGRKVAAKWESAIAIWNDAMMVYKTCQPCRAYNLNPNLQQSSHDKQGRDMFRFLGDNNEGEGTAEPWGYDCNDDAGYLNCNQCYKFETKTDMEAATTIDLERASKQGTILHIKVNGTHYGMGGYESFYLGPEAIAERGLAITAIVLTVLVVVYHVKRCCGMKFEKSPRPRPLTKGEYQAHPDDYPAIEQPSVALANKRQALSCVCDVGPVSTEVRVLVQKPMYRD